MKKRIITYVCAAALAAVLTAGCGNTQKQAAADNSKETVLETESASDTESQSEETKSVSDTEAQSEKAALEDGEYLVDFDTDSSMFHVSEACDGKGTLTVKDGKMMLHISLASKKIVNLYPGLAENAKKDEANILQPTTDEVTYSDGMTEEVYGFDVPVPAIDEEFDLALIGTKGKWYDHKVSVSNPEKAE